MLENYMIDRTEFEMLDYAAQPTNLGDNESGTTQNLTSGQPNNYESKLRETHSRAMFLALQPRRKKEFGFHDTSVTVRTKAIQWHQLTIDLTFPHPLGFQSRVCKKGSNLDPPALSKLFHIFP